MIAIEDNILSEAAGRFRMVAGPNDFFDILEKFWDKVEDYSELGKEKAELKNLYNKYLNEFEMPF